MAAKKKDVRIAAINGVGLDFSDVARLSRSRGVVTLRHSWADDDGRAQHAVLQCVRSAAAEIVRSGVVSVEIRDRAGFLLDVITE